MAYLKRVKHVGGARAARLLERYGEGVLEAIDDDPAARVPRRRAHRRSASTRRSAPGTGCAPRARCTCCSRRTGWPGSCPGSPASTATARTRWSRRGRTSSRACSASASTSPTRSRAPSGVPPDSVGRRRAAVVHVLTEAEREGSTCLPVPELASKAGALLGGPAPDAALLQAMADAGQLVLEIDAPTPPTATAAAPARRSTRRARHRVGLPARHRGARGRARRDRPRARAAAARARPARAAGRRPRARARAGGGGARRVRVAPVDRHGRPRAPARPRRSG